MKKSIIFLMVFVSTICNCQNIGLDTTFGTNGTVLDSSIGTFPKAVFFENNKYLFVFNEGFCSKNYDGSSDTNFGTNGKTFFYNSTETFLTKGAKFQNGFIYIYGQVSTNSNPDNKNIFLAKISTAGVFDTTFGNNGFVKLDLGSNEEIINDITINEDGDGKILTIGDKDALIFVSKININGTLDTSFNAIGYKQFPLNANEISVGASIYNDLGNYILVGSSTYPSNIYNSSKYLVFFKMDYNGNLISNYGTNGVKSVTLATGSPSYKMINSRLISNNLYITYHYAWSYNDQYKRIIKYNLVTDAYTELNYVPTQYFDFVLDANQNIYVTGAGRCLYSNTCGRKFQLSKNFPNGVLDTSFNTIGGFEYRFFPNDIMPEDISTVLYRHTDGKILVGGYAGGPYSVSGFGMIRVMDTPLSSPIFDNDSFFVISPNPANQELNIDSKQGVIITKIEIIDANGRLILSQNKDFQKVIIENLQQGLYFLKIKAEDTESVLKFIKK